MGKVEVENHVDRRYIQTPSRNVRRNEYVSASRAELAQRPQPGRLRQLAVERNGAVPERAKQDRDPLGFVDGAGEDDHGL